MPIHNEQIAAIFEEMADLLEIEDANPFRVRAYRNAARMIRGMWQELNDLVARDEDLSRLHTIGSDLAAKIKEILITGHVRSLDTLHKAVPASVEELLKVPGLGPKRVKMLFHDLHIKTLPQLQNAARLGQLSNLPGFGVKTLQHILDTNAIQP